MQVAIIVLTIRGNRHTTRHLKRCLYFDIHQVEQRIMVNHYAANVSKVRLLLKAINLLNLH